MFPLKPLLLSGSVLCAAFLGGSSLQASTILFENALPTTDILLSNTQKSGSGGIQVYNLSASSARSVGFGFQSPTASLLDKVTFTIIGSGVSSGALGASLTISIVSLSSLTAAPDTPYTPFYSESGIVPSSYSSEGYFTIDLNTPVQLAANGNYGIMLSFDSPATGRGINLWQSSVGTAGTSGRGSNFYTTDGGATFTTVPNGAALTFTLQTVPEPSTYALAVLGVSGLALAWKRKARLA